MWELRELLEAERDAKAFNVGINAGAAAGQTVPHAHVHLIPRYEGDVPDPRGGIRWVLPERARVLGVAVRRAARRPVARLAADAR